MVRVRRLHVGDGKSGFPHTSHPGNDATRRSRDFLFPQESVRIGGMNEVSKSEVAMREEDVLEFWRQHNIFEKSLEKTSPKGEFIFYEGPPTANGRPGVHHLEARAFKDAIPRYKTMRGYHVRRRAGWDTHGLPVELEVEKELKFSGKKDIEKYGIVAFNKKCRASVLKYIDEWQKFTDRIGYWVDQSKAYFTYDATYMESVWSIFKHIDNDKRLYKDYKIVPWCTRCGTALSSHELAQGYKEVKDLAVTVEFKVIGKENTSFLAWTTTPWTLPGNVALAVGEKITYVTIEKKDEGSGAVLRFILAKERLQSVFGEDEYTVVEEHKGSDLVGMKYEPVYPFMQKLATDSQKPKFSKAFQVYPASFVTTEDGTGIVHIAVMYGQDDFELGAEIGLPKVHMVAPDGLFIAGTGFLEARFVKDEELAIDIIKDLAKKEVLFAKGKHEHTYPFCWRCKTPLIYYARDSWYIRMRDLRDEMVAQNKQVHWEPEYIRDGRFGDWISKAKDWAISRERYWGTPLPVWENTDNGERITIGSIEELKQRMRRSGNTYLIMRHGQAQSNVTETVDTNLSARRKNNLTETGCKQVLQSAKEIKEHGGVDIIVTSPFPRARETAEIVAKELGISKDAIQTDERLRETGAGELDGASYKEWDAFFVSTEEKLTKAPPKGETHNEIRRRIAELLYEIEERYSAKRILLISHEGPLWMSQLVALGTPHTGTYDIFMYKNAQYGVLDFAPLPHNENYELDLHRPYIDDVVLVGKKEDDLYRVPEVIDVWFDSGAMPFASEHYPFENKEWVEGIGYPADFISEAIDQTRGWFYTLLAVGTLMNRGAAYKNVISLGHLQDENGQKMSKSKGNIIKPWEAIDKWGVDTLRFWMYSVNQPGEAKSFDEKTVREAARTLSWFENSTKFYELFKDRASSEKSAPKIIDQWMQLRTQQTVRAVTSYFDNYKYFDGARAIATLLEDLSQWYVRRIRDRAREGDSATIETLRETLQVIALLIAPLSPFIAERVFQHVRKNTDAESVHLAQWPEEGVPLYTYAVRTVSKEEDDTLLSDMERVRSYASEALMLRQKEGTKVRQPLGALSIPENLSDELSAILAEEVNVKQVKTNAQKLELDTVLTPELIHEGDMREFSRAIAQVRKDAGFSPSDVITLSVEASAQSHMNGEVFAGVSDITFASVDEKTHSVKLSFGLVHFSIQHNAS
ncbi:MAG TPA: isoleucine--tRNA ligase [Candidatus Kaiserbacteria bacterium]|nr:isoleucine--tRNA ligase [Candidatus Kaiserbacteria bacterium]